MFDSFGAYLDVKLHIFVKRVNKKCGNNYTARAIQWVSRSKIMLYVNSSWVTFLLELFLGVSHAMHLTFLAGFCTQQLEHDHVVEVKLVVNKPGTGAGVSNSVGFEKVKGSLSTELGLSDFKGNWKI